jgi:hypothetical protein
VCLFELFAIKFDCSIIQMIGEEMCLEYVGFRLSKNIFKLNFSFVFTRIFLNDGFSFDHLHICDISIVTKFFNVNE